MFAFSESLHSITILQLLLCIVLFLCYYSWKCFNKLTTGCYHFGGLSLHSPIRADCFKLCSDSPLLKSGTQFSRRNNRGTESEQSCKKRHSRIVVSWGTHVLTKTSGELTDPLEGTEMIRHASFHIQYEIGWMTLNIVPCVSTTWIVTVEKIQMIS